MNWVTILIGRLLPWLTRQPSGRPPSPAGLNLVARINAERQAHGLGPLQVDPDLTSLAATWAGRMAEAGRLSHGDFAGRVAARYPDQFTGETISAWPTPERTVAAWMESPGHRAHLLQPAYRFVGAAAAQSSSGITYWCADFRS